ncbi:hypothetical protein Ahy_B07g086757 [Arachis hypogaea]|uniref:Uncharacterized protein n=1 Tax=Arachis hypogaea TaxID=3818 RepID=A0A444YAU1_ARAHY|nr:hypothetical protein Ahy_B07g086757 [Arachis hypogaea]
MRLRSEKIIHMADELSNVNGGSSTNASIPRKVEESHHDLVNLLTQQMTTILNPMMADHESRFERLARQVDRIARIVDSDEGKRHNARGTNEGMENIFQNKNHEKVAYVTMGSSEEEIDFGTEVDLAELKKGPPYERMKKELAHREEQACQRQPIRRVEGSSSKIPLHDVNTPLSRSQAIGVQWVRNCQEFQRKGSKQGGNSSVHSRIVFPSDGETYPKEIPSPAKMDKGKAIAQSSGVDKHKDVDVDEEYFDKGDDDMVGTISIIPTEYLGECEGNPDEDYDQEDEEAFSFIRIEDEPGFFARPTERTFGKVALSRYAFRADGLGLFFLKISKTEPWTRLMKFPII